MRTVATGCAFGSPAVLSFGPAASVLRRLRPGLASLNVCGRRGLFPADRSGGIGGAKASSSMRGTGGGEAASGGRGGGGNGLQRQRDRGSGNGSQRGRGPSAGKPRQSKKYVGDPMVGPNVLPHPPPESYDGAGTAIMWFRNDLRIEDNAALALANTAERMVPVYVFDERHYGPESLSPHGFQRTGPFRAQFILQSVKALRTALRWKMSDLVVRIGVTEEEILDVAQTLVDAGYGPVRVVTHKEVTREEVDVEKAVADALGTVEAAEMDRKAFTPVTLDYVWGATMLHVDDLRFNPAGPALPPTFTDFRKAVEAEPVVAVRGEIAAPEVFREFPRELRIESDDWPSLGGDLKVDGLASPNDYPFPDPKACFRFEGGELKGRERMEDWIFKEQSLLTYFESRNESGTASFSSKFSPWLALGCLSSRTIYWACKRFEEKYEANKSTYWMVFEILTRDYFHWIAAQAGDKLFALNGFTGRSPSDRDIWRLPASAFSEEDKTRLDAWISGETGAPFVDANMRELAATGYMSNRGRQNAASFLVHDLKYPDWRAGAEYFESQLIDHDVAANWGNWAYIAGVGSDPRGGRRFNVVKQAMRYDPDGWFTKRWCDELQDLPPPYVHEPHTVPFEDLEAIGIVQGKTYPLPVVPLLKAPSVKGESPLQSVQSPFGDYVPPANDPKMTPEELRRLRNELREIREELTVYPGASDSSPEDMDANSDPIAATEEAKK
jgi:deoxyribodipyrimidine photo-lyase